MALAALANYFDKAYTFMEMKLEVVVVPVADVDRRTLKEGL